MKREILKSIGLAIAFLIFVFLTGCETHRAEVYRQMYSDYVKASTGNGGQATFEACSLRVPKGGSLPEGFEMRCNAPVIHGYAGAVVQPPQYPPASPGWAVLETLINRGASVTMFGLGVDAFRSVMHKAFDNSGHNTIDSYNTSGSYNTDSHDTSITDSYNTDRHDISDSYNDRHDISNSYNPVDNHSTQ